MIMIINDFNICGAETTTKKINDYGEKKKKGRNFYRFQIPVVWVEAKLKAANC